MTPSSTPLRSARRCGRSACLPWPVFQAVWFLGCVAVLAWLLAPLGWRRGLILAPFFVSELLLGNVYLLFAGSLVLSLGRLPGAVALPALTKVAPGVVAVWFVVRGRVAATAWAVGTTAAIVLVSVLLAPEAWVRLGAVPRHVRR